MIRISLELEMEKCLPAKRIPIHPSRCNNKFGDLIWIWIILTKWAPSSTQASHLSTPPRLVDTAISSPPNFTAQREILIQLEMDHGVYWNWKVSMAIKNKCRQPTWKHFVTPSSPHVFVFIYCIVWVFKCDSIYESQEFLGKEGDDEDGVNSLWISYICNAQALRNDDR